MTYCFGDISIWNWRILLSFCWVSIFFDISIGYMSWTVARTPINHTIFWKSVMRTFRCIYIIALTHLGFLLRSAQNCKRCTFLDNSQTINQEENMETRQMTPFLHLLFLLCLEHSFLYLKLVKIHFHVVPSLVHSGL